MDLLTFMHPFLTIQDILMDTLSVQTITVILYILKKKLMQVLTSLLHNSSLKRQHTLSFIVIVVRWVLLSL